MHTILGAGGSIANHLTNELINRSHEVRLVSRRPVTKFVTEFFFRCPEGMLNARQA